MPVNIWPLPDQRLRISGSVSIKMTDYQIEPPSPKFLPMLIKTGDAVKIIFDWMLARKPPVATAEK
jgi:hypothetical protein